VTELQFHSALAWTVIGVGGLVFASLFVVVAPYGRHVRAGWGVTISNRTGWVVMESPAALAFAAIYAAGDHALQPMPLALAAMWLTHYVHRAFVYPLRLRAAQKPMPASVALMAIVFNLINAYLNARWISHLGHYETSQLREWPFLLGLLGFAAGMAVNLHADAVLRALRRPGETGYGIPRGGAYALVSAPNYLGELVEWASWALASGSLAGLAFFLFTFANLVPRAVSNHRWYRHTFPDYPPDRRAILPWVL
jgi:protein-S-isoprenylcysteine O-methyltransferase Ste14